MLKKKFSKYFKTIVLMTALIFFAVEAIQAQDSTATRQEEIVTSDDGTEQRTLDGDTNNPDGGDSLVIEEGGVILTTADDEHGVDMSGSNNEVTVEGKITTEGDADGIHSTDDNAKITIEATGEIEAEDDGIDVDGDNAKITNRGSITAEEEGIDSYGDNAEITNSGTITAGEGGIESGDDETGGHNVIITNEAGGTITAVEEGIRSKGNNVKITNSGTIFSEEEDGIYSNGEDAEITNEAGGTITAGGDGIDVRTDPDTDVEDQDADGGNHVIKNYGSIDAVEDGIYVQGNNAEITNEAGGIITAGDDGIDVDGDNAKITNKAEGTILAVEDGIVVDGDLATIDNSGSITAGEDGINVDGEGNFITNRGTINAGVDADGNVMTESDGIDVEGEGNTIINDVDATITAVGDGIEVEGEGNTIINEVGATIIAGDDGIYVETEEDLDIEEHAEDSGNNIVINKGKIEAASDGMYIKGNNAEITNAAGATIIAVDDGIYLKGNNAEITNEAGGAITAGNDGIEVLGNNAKITNRGTINAEGHGIDVEGEGNTIINSGTIKAGAEGNAEEIAGIHSVGDDATIINYGSIETDSNASDGISLKGDNGNILNYGRIYVAGPESFGIWIDSEEGEMNTISNYGSIHAEGEDSYAILGEDGNELVNLYSSSDICGDIDLGEGNDILNYYVGAKVKGRIDLAEGQDTANVIGTGRPTVAHTLTFYGAENINFNNVIGVRNGDTATTIDPSIQSVKAPALNSFTTGLHNVINDRLGTKLNKTYFWADTFHSYRERNSEGVLFKYNQRYNGMMLGYDISDEKFRFGIMAGISDGKTEGKYDSFETDTSSFFGGIYSEYDFGIFRIATALIGGYEDHKDQRMVIDNEVSGCGDEGYQMAIADHESYFFSPSITLSRSFEISQQLSLEPSATAVYSIGWYESYEEIGTVNSNLGINDRTIDAFNGKVQLKSIYRASERIQLGVYGGATVTYTDDEVIDGDFGGTGYSYAAMNDDSVYGVQGGAYVDIAVKENFNLNFNFEHSEMDGDEKRDFITGGFLYKF